MRTCFFFFFMALADEIVSIVKSEDLKSFVDPSVDGKMLEEHCNTVTKLQRFQDLET